MLMHSCVCVSACRHISAVTGASVCASVFELFVLVRVRAGCCSRFLRLYETQKLLVRVSREGDHSRARETISGPETVEKTKQNNNKKKSNSLTLGPKKSAKTNDKLLFLLPSLIPSHFPVCSSLLLTALIPTFDSHCFIAAKSNLPLH